ncbi:MAG: hypothetical protein Q9179_000162 [Wetmoreana sp. 5 TL-2023]
MDMFIASLEADLGYMETPPTNAAPRIGHGNSNELFDLPPDSTSQLNPPSGTKSLFPFGNDGTLAWTTSAGELLQVASRIDTRLMGVEYKRSIALGSEYDDRRKMLERALDWPQGSGSGIGISLRGNLELVEKSWVHNRWPRFHFKHGGLNIRLQYYIDSGSVVQEYLVRNDSLEDKSLPYSFSSNVCFREHRGDSRRFYSIDEYPSRERLFLFQNSEVVIWNETQKCQLTMGLFLNSQRKSLWNPANNSKRNIDVEASLNPAGESKKWQEIEKDLRDNMLEGKFPHRMADSDGGSSWRRGQGPRRPRPQQQTHVASHKDDLLVPGGSTQELRAVIRVSTFPLLEEDSTELQLNVDSDPVAEAIGREEEQDLIRRIQNKLELLEEEAEKLPSEAQSQQEEQQRFKFYKDHMKLGADCARVKLANNARYHLLAARIIAEYMYGQSSYLAYYTRYKYARTLDRYEWYSLAAEEMEQLHLRLKKSKLKGEEISVLRKKVLSRLGPMYMEQGKFFQAEEIYMEALPSSLTDEKNLGLNAARCLERLAWAQAQQKKYQEARHNYNILLNSSSTRRGSVLSNLGFIESRLNDMESAKSLFKDTLTEPCYTFEDVLKRFFARSALFTCLHKVEANSADEYATAKTQTQYVDNLFSAFRSACLCFPIADGPLRFAISRHLESSLSMCSIPLRNQGFQFRFLTQCQKYIDNLEHVEVAMKELSTRIKTTCRDHLLWVFRHATILSNDTWHTLYTIGGDPLDESVQPGDPCTSRTIEGAYQFSKLWLYLNTWSDEWELVLSLLKARLDPWLSYLRSTQHMGNLWVEKQGNETLMLFDTINHYSGSSYRMFPQYHLSDFAMLWLALRQLETVLELIEGNTDFNNGQHDDYRKMLVDVKQTFEDHLKKLSILKIQSNVLKTFRVSKQDPTLRFVADQKPAIRRVEDESAKSWIPGSPDSPHYLDVPRMTLEPSPQDHRTSELDLQFIALQRSISEYVLEIQATDLVTVEAATVGFFKDSRDQLNLAWRETLKLHRDWFIPDIQDPRQIALTLFAAKFDSVISKHPEHEIEDLCCTRLMTALYDSGAFAQKLIEDMPQPSRSHSVVSFEIMSILVGCKFKKCAPIPDAYYLRPSEPIQQSSQSQQTSGTDGALAKRMAIVTPQQASPSSRSVTKSVVYTALLPDWMYHNPEWIRERPIDIDAKGAIHEISSIDIFGPAINRLKEPDLFKDGGDNRLSISEYRFPPHVGDFGRKNSNEKGSSAVKRRQMSLNWYYDGLEFYRRLKEPRSLEEAKKRLIELPTHKMEVALICWLMSPRLERQYFGDFLRRHGSSTSLFGECIDWKGDIWETEFHLGFYQLAKQSEYERYYDSQLARPETILVPPEVSDESRIISVALSFRFVGDLRDRSWTCHFLTSVSRSHGFYGFLDDFTDVSDIDDEGDTLYTDTVGQRKILELLYVERILKEIEESSEEILEAFGGKLNVSRDLQDESYKSKLSYSNLHMDSGEVFHKVTRQIEDALGVIGEWEGRVSARPVQSRWSMKNQKRYKNRMDALARNCKVIIRDLHRQKNRFEEHQKLFKQRHTHLITSMQLQDARISARSAEDVRIFSAPNSNTISIMVQTTVVALALTVVILSNMKLLDRNWDHQMSWLNRATRTRMGKMKDSYWNGKAKDLEQSAQPENGLRLPAESKWYYFFFWLCIILQALFSWLCIILQAPRRYVLQGLEAWDTRQAPSVNRAAFCVKVSLAVSVAPACLIIFVVEILAKTAFDTLNLMQKGLRSQWKAILDQARDEQRRSEGLEKIENKAALGAEGDAEATSEDPENLTNVSPKRSSTESSVENGRRTTTISILKKWLGAPPRPIKDYTMTKYSLTEAHEKETQSADSDQKDKPLIESDDESSDGEGLDFTLDKDQNVANDLKGPHSHQGHALQSGTVEDSGNERMPWRTRWRRKLKHGKVTEEEGHV